MRAAAFSQRSENDVNFGNWFGCCVGISNGTWARRWVARVGSQLCEQPGLPGLACIKLRRDFYAGREVAMNDNVINSVTVRGKAHESYVLTLQRQHRVLMALS